jgi:hypothetical protein
MVVSKTYGCGVVEDVANAWSCQRVVVAITGNALSVCFKSLKGKCTLQSRADLQAPAS